MSCRVCICSYKGTSLVMPLPTHLPLSRTVHIDTRWISPYYNYLPPSTRIHMTCEGFSSLVTLREHAARPIPSLSARGNICTSLCGKGRGNSPSMMNQVSMLRINERQCHAIGEKSIHISLRGSSLADRSVRTRVVPLPKASFWPIFCSFESRRPCCHHFFAS